MARLTVARLMLLLSLLGLAGVVLAQQIEPLTPPTGTEQIAITYPVPVLTVSGEVTITGSAALPNLSNYFIEFRPLVLAGPGTPTPAEGSWFPATLPSARPVTNGVLGVWNTATAPDGLYELRLVVIAGGRTEFFRVSPVRVLNEPAALSPFATVVSVQATQPAALSGPAATQAALATLFASQNIGGGAAVQATPTPAVARGPQVIAITNANVRRGDSTAYPTVGSLLIGASAPIVGISSTGSGWFHIRLPNGRLGFISPSVVRVEGSVLGLPLVTPPPVPATPTPAATPTPVTTTDLVLSGIRPEPNPPVCLSAFNVFINATNLGSGASAGPANLRVQNVHLASGIVTTGSTVQIPVLSPGQNWLVVIPLNVDTFFAEEHELVATINFDNLVPETNAGNNTIRFRYVLQQGGC